VEGLQPHIVFVIADDHRGDAVHALGDPNVLTPNFDALCESGVVFRQARCQGGMTDAICATSRACVMTARNVFNAVASNELPETESSLEIKEGVKTLPAVLREWGYRTVAVGKWHNGVRAFGESFDEGRRVFFGGMGPQWKMTYWDGICEGGDLKGTTSELGGFTSDVIGHAAEAVIEGATDDQPLFLYVAFTAPHDPRVPPGPFADMYEASGLVLTPDYYSEAPAHEAVRYVRDEMLVGYPRSMSQVRRHLADYYGMISNLDLWVGRLFGAAQEGLAGREVLFVYCSDHGLSVGRHGLMGKQNLYEHSVRIPVMMSGSYVTRRACDDSLVGHQDICATIAEAAGLVGGDSAAIGDGSGTSLIGKLRTGRGIDEAGNDGSRKFWFAVYKDVERMVCDGRWKVIYSRLPGAKGTAHVLMQVFDLENDPWEVFDLSATQRGGAIAAAFRGELFEWMKWSGDPVDFWGDRGADSLQAF